MASIYEPVEPGLSVGLDEWRARLGVTIPTCDAACVAAWPNGKHYEYEGQDVGDDGRPVRVRLVGVLTPDGIFHVVEFCITLLDTQGHDR